jgi:quercetin dioxygenase-like cupin family protein
MKRLLLLWVLLVIAIGPAALVGCGRMGTSEQTTTPSATSPPAKATATPIVGATLGKFEDEYRGIKVESVPDSADIALVKVVLDPGGSTGWHHHPGVGLASVKSGAVTFYHQDCHKSVYKAGEGFLDSHDEPILVRNEGNVEAVFYVTFIIPTNTPFPEGLTIVDPQPKNCDVK